MSCQLSPDFVRCCQVLLNLSDVVTLLVCIEVVMVVVVVVVIRLVVMAVVTRIDPAKRPNNACLGYMCGMLSLCVW